MTETFEYKGKWSVPGTDLWLYGILYFNPNDGATLEVFGTFGKNIFENSNQPIIIGKTNFGCVTLLDNHFRSSSSNLDDVNICHYEPIFILTGHCFENKDQLRFGSAIFQLFNLLDWFNFHGHKFSLDTGLEYSINYKAPESIPFNFQGCNGIVNFSGLPDIRKSSDRITLKEECFVTFNYQNKHSVTDIINDIGVFINFITLSTFEQSYPLSITFQDDDYFEEINGQKGPNYIKCYFRHRTYSPVHKSRQKFEHLLQYERIQTDFSQIINNWYKEYQIIKPCFDLLLYSFFEKYKFSVEKFMDILRGLETFHRITQKNERLPKNQYNELRKSILNGIELNSEDEIWLNGLLYYGNEPSLKQRLNDLILNYSNIYIEKSITNVEKFCTDVKNSRNYYTHFDPKSKDKALTGQSLFNTYECLLGLLISCIYSRIGIEKSVYEKGLFEKLVH